MPSLPLPCGEGGAGRAYSKESPGCQKSNGVWPLREECQRRQGGQANRQEEGCRGEEAVTLWYRDQRQYCERDHEPDPKRSNPGNEQGAP